MNIISQLESTRDQTLRREERGLLEFVHSETVGRTLKDEFNKVAAHNQHHLNQIETALRRNE